MAVSKTIYVGSHGKMTMIREPHGQPRYPNFIITWRGLHWSGYRTLPECIAQFPELEARGENSLNDFAVIED